RLRTELGRELLEQGALDVEVLHDRFDHEVAIADAAQVIVEVADADQACRVSVVEGSGLGSERAFESAGSEAAARLGVVLVGFARVRRYDVQQFGSDAGASKMRRDGAAHDTRSEYCGLADHALHSS